MNKKHLQLRFGLGYTQISIHHSVRAIPFHDYWTPTPYDYDKATRGLAEKLQAYMELADAQEDEVVAKGIRGTALHIYERWHQFSTESGRLKA